MERDLAGAALSAQDFERIAAACRHDGKFPSTYEAWRSLVAAGTAHLHAQGQHVRVVSLVVDEFLAWCTRVQVVPCLDALRAYMILLRRTEHDVEKESEAAIETSERNDNGRGEGEAVAQTSRRHLGALLRYVERRVRERRSSAVPHAV